MKPLLENKVAVVTGSGRGIGEAIARKLAEAGASVVVTDFVLENAKQVADDLCSKGFNAKAIYFDVGDFSYMEGTIKKIKDLFGKIDIWVNNAGITESGSVEDITEERWDKLQKIDLKSVFFCTKIVYKMMKAQNYGKFVHVSSIAAKKGVTTSSASYAAAKAGVINVAKSFAIAGGKYNITSNCVCPGHIKTKMAEQLKFSSDLVNGIPMGRLGEPEDIANAVLFFASDLSGYVTGCALDVNGGEYMV